MSYSLNYDPKEKLKGETSTPGYTIRELEQKVNNRWLIIHPKPFESKCYRKWSQLTSERLSTMPLLL